jgi:hypothetical protein
MIPIHPNAHMLNDSTKTDQFLNTLPYEQHNICVIIPHSSQISSLYRYYHHQQQTCP